jgi:hypothetical protein
VGFFESCCTCSFIFRDRLKSVVSQISIIPSQETTASAVVHKVCQLHAKDYDSPVLEMRDPETKSYENKSLVAKLSLLRNDFSFVYFIKFLSPR